MSNSNRSLAFEEIQETNLEINKLFPIQQQIHLIDPVDEQSSFKNEVKVTGNIVVSF